MSPFEHWMWGDPPKAFVRSYENACIRAADLVISELKKDADVLPGFNAAGDLVVTVIAGNNGELEFKRKLDFGSCVDEDDSDELASSAAALRRLADKLDRRGKLKAQKERE